jgi:hypothetical protein
MPCAAQSVSGKVLCCEYSEYRQPCAAQSVSGKVLCCEYSEYLCPVPPSQSAVRYYACCEQTAAKLLSV